MKDLMKFLLANSWEVTRIVNAVGDVIIRIVKETKKGV